MPNSFPPLYILRHGQTFWNLEKRLQGRLNSDLTEVGKAQAALQARLVAPAFQRHPEMSVFCSPAGRAMETAAIVLQGRDIVPKLDDRLAEISAGEWEGLTQTEVLQEYPEAQKITNFNASMFFDAVGGEGREALRLRCSAFLRDLSGPSLLISHGVTGAYLRGLACRMDLKLAEKLERRQGCVFVIEDGQEQIWAA